MLRSRKESVIDVLQIEGPLPRDRQRRRPNRFLARIEARRQLHLIASLSPAMFVRCDDCEQ
jgi:hypothetical protein